MYSSSTKINQLVKSIVFGTAKSKRQTTPKIFQNGRLTPYGIIEKKPRTYDYDLPQDLPNRHLYYNRTQSNKLSSKRYHQHRLYKLKIQPIHDQQGNRTFNRELAQILSQLTSINLIKESLGRTLQNMHEVILKHREQVLEEGEHLDVLKYAMDQVHERHLPTMTFYQFCTFCQLRFRAKLEPTQTLLVYFFKHMKEIRDENRSIPIERLSKLSRYIFSRIYPEEYKDLLYEKKREFKLFQEEYEKKDTLESVINDLFLEQELQRVEYSGEELRKISKGLRRLPGGSKLIQKLQNGN